MTTKLKIALLQVAIAMMFVGPALPISSAWAIATASNEDIAVSLATLLRSARAVISKNQKHINDAKVGDKGITADLVEKVARENYKKATKSDLSGIDANSRQGKLIAAEIKAIRDVMDEAQESINREGVGLKGFLPAVFARLVTEKFGANTGGKATLKLTAPKKLVRNRANRPDKWEHNIIEKQFKAAGLDDSIKLYTVFTVDHMTLKAHGKAAIGTFHTSFWDPESNNPANQRFIRDYKAKYGKHPSMFAVQGYDAALLIDLGVRGANGDLSDHDAIRSAMRTAAINSPRGGLSFNVNHNPIQNYYKREVIADANGEPAIVTRSVVFRGHHDSYEGDCKMVWN